MDRALFEHHYRGFVLIRLMQALGAFGYRGFFERKRHFLESVPYAARNLQHLLEIGLPADLPELESVFRRIAAEWAEAGSRHHQESDLVVLVQSFSYKDGYPPDVEGHGGGFVFDCRALPNPHRQPELRDLTGKDPTVADYMERLAAVQEYWASVRAMVEQQVEDYMSRGFASLTVSFGCTGGQHRSVFMAEKLARHLSERFPTVGVRLVHRRLEGQ